VLFDVAGFLHQGLNPHSVDVESINKRQQKMLEVMHKELEAERACRLASGCNVPLVEHFVCTGDGYYMICNPNTETILDIAHCIRGLLDAHSIPAYIIGHVGPVHTFVDLTGRTNVTSYAMGVAARIQGLAKDTSGLICSEDLVEHWVDNEYYDLTAPVREGTAKDGVTFRWRMAQRLGPLPQQS
jgi:hypothetical protein